MTSLEQSTKKNGCTGTLTPKEEKKLKKISEIFLAQIELPRKWLNDVTFLILILMPAYAWDFSGSIAGSNLINVVFKVSWLSEKKPRIIHKTRDKTL